LRQCLRVAPETKRAMGRRLPPHWGHGGPRQRTFPRLRLSPTVLLGALLRSLMAPLPGRWARSTNTRSRVRGVGMRKPERGAERRLIRLTASRRTQRRQWPRQLWKGHREVTPHLRLRWLWLS
jgi:hypothetical protein